MTIHTHSELKLNIDPLGHSAETVALVVLFEDGLRMPTTPALREVDL